MKSLVKSLLIILPREDLLRMTLSSGLLIFVAFVEVVGLGLISFLLINIQQLYGSIMLLPFASLAVSYFDIAAENVVYIFFILVLAYSISASIISIFSVRSISVSSQLIGSRLRGRVLKYFLHSDWMEISKVQSSEKISKLINDGRQVGFMISFCLHFFSRLALASLIVIGLLLYNFQLTVTMVSVLLTVYGLIFFILQPSIYKNGADGAKQLSITLKILTNIFGSLKEIMFYGVQDKFIQDYKDADSGLAWAEGGNVYLSQIPRFLIDSIILILLVLGVLYLYGQENNDILFFGTISVYGLASLKLLPAFQNIYYFYHEIIARQVHLKNILEISMLINDAKPEGRQALGDPISNEIAFKNVSFQYSKGDQSTLKNININISYGKNIAIIGPSGSGKSTFVDLLLGFLDPMNGEILIDNNVLSNKNKQSIRENFAYVPQKVYLIEDTLRENIIFGSSDSKDQDVNLDESISRSQLKSVVEKLPGGLDTILSESNQHVSGGEKQSIGIARALLKKANILILDEATNAMDHELEAATIDYLLNHSSFKTVICITHKPALLKYFDEIYVFDAGEITASGTYEEIISNNSFLAAMMKDS
jgi:ATP-binding cassette, subfamily B, bacterial PglK